MVVIKRFPSNRETLRGWASTLVAVLPVRSAISVLIPLAALEGNPPKRNIATPMGKVAKRTGSCPLA